MPSLPTERSVAIVSAGMMPRQIEVVCDLIRMPLKGRVPTRWEDNRKLGRWVSLQRCQYKDFISGRKTVMTRERIEMLEGIGFEWEISSRGFYHYEKGGSSAN